MKDFKKTGMLTFLCLVLLFSSCTTIPTESPSISNAVPEHPLLVPEDPDTASREMLLTLESMEKQMAGYERDIDDREWITAYINYLAGRDLFIIEKIHFHLKYSNWESDQKKKFVEFFLNPSYLKGQPGPDPAYLQKLRLEVLEELKYLSEYSFLLKDYPWIIRSRYNEKSEFSFWYLIYISKDIDHLWVENTILPAMLKLIPVDEITPVSYLWLKTPGSLSSMDREILMSGYPWTTLTHILRINQELLKALKILYQDEPSPGWNSEGALI